MVSDKLGGTTSFQPLGADEIARHREALCERIRSFVPAEYAYHADGIRNQGVNYRIAGLRQINPRFRSFHLDRIEQAVRGKLGYPRHYRLLHIFGKAVRIFAWMLKTAESAERPGLVRDYRDLLRRLLHTRNLTWGLSNAMAGLMDLQALGESDDTDYIAAIFGPMDRRFMRRDLHWNKHFDMRTGKLIGLPNNYYPVMAWVALGRARLGWDDASMLEMFIERSLDGFVDPSGNGWFDDSGVGTYDVYHSVATYELVDLIRAYDLTKTSRLKLYCDNLAEEYLYMGQVDGSGFPFGRTVGVNGDMWMASGLLMCMTLGYGEPARYGHYYRLAAAAIDKAMTFWYDGERHISNKWFDGRRTDPYMDESRILDATLDLYLRLMQANDMLEGLEPREWMQPQIPAPQGGHLLRHSDDGENQKATFVYRTEARSYTFPMVAYGRPNGQMLYYTNYLPNVRSNGVLESPIYEDQAFLNPRIRLKGGSAIRPYAYYRDIEWQETGAGGCLTWRQNRFGRTGSAAGEQAGLEYRCVWLITDNFLARIDFWVCEAETKLDSYEIEYATMGQLVGADNGRYRIMSSDVHLDYGPIPGNMGLMTKTADVGERPDYRTYAGQCRYRISSGSADPILRPGELYYSGFSIFIDGAPAPAQMNGDPVRFDGSVKGRHFVVEANGLSPSGVDVHCDKT